MLPFIPPDWSAGTITLGQVFIQVVKLGPPLVGAYLIACAVDLWQRARRREED